jgi:hypothetical protein
MSEAEVRWGILATITEFGGGSELGKLAAGGEIIGIDEKVGAFLEFDDGSFGGDIGGGIGEIV